MLRQKIWIILRRCRYIFLPSRVPTLPYILAVLSATLLFPPSLIIFVWSLVLHTNFMLYTKLLHSLISPLSISTISYKPHILHKAVRTKAFHASVSISAISCSFFRMGGGYMQLFTYLTCKIHYLNVRTNIVGGIANISTTQTRSLASSCFS